MKKNGDLLQERVELLFAREKRPLVDRFVVLAERCIRFKL